LTIVDGMQPYIVLDYTVSCECVFMQFHANE
jgi:hypothetical protein